jgi:hypothetical protein
VKASLLFPSLVAHLSQQSLRYGCVVEARGNQGNICDELDAITVGNHANYIEEELRRIEHKCGCSVSFMMTGWSTADTNTIFCSMIFVACGKVRHDEKIM